MFWAQLFEVIVIGITIIFTLYYEQERVPGRTRIGNSGVIYCLAERSSLCGFFRTTF